MTTLREASQQALEALEKPNAGLVPHNGEWMSIQSIAIATLRAALEETPTNQCGETCERAKMCAACARVADLEQTSLELCETCGWRTLIPGDVCLNCTRSDPDELTIVYMMGYEEGMKAVLKKMEDRLKEKEARDA